MRHRPPPRGADSPATALAALTSALADVRAASDPSDVAAALRSAADALDGAADPAAWADAAATALDGVAFCCEAALDDGVLEAAFALAAGLADESGAASTALCDAPMLRRALGPLTTRTLLASPCVRRARGRPRS
jgi:hypothetical protein